MDKKSIVKEIIQSYEDLVIKAYCTIRFHILRQRFLEEIGQYLPTGGKILDIGCGFGLFSLYFAKTHPDCFFNGIDLSSKRIAYATQSAQKLGITNAQYTVGSASELKFEQAYDAIYAIDIIHHIPRSDARNLLRNIHQHLSTGGVLLIKDIEEKPKYKVWFTYLLDKLMDYKTPVSYWEKADLMAFLKEIGFSVHSHAMIDYLPYPHILYVCRKST